MTGPMPLPMEDLEDVLERVGPLWRQLEGARLLLTGCTGFFGAWLLESLLLADQRNRLGIELLVLTRDKARIKERLPHLMGHSSLRLLEGDARTLEDPGGPITHVIHGAVSTRADWNAEHPEDMIDLLLGGTRRALSIAVRANARRFLLLSSGAVYGPQPPGLEHVSEEYLGAHDTMDLGGGYGLGKRLAEHFCALAGAREGLACTMARCFAFLAPRLPLDAHFAAGNFLQDALAGRDIRIKGDGTPCRSYLYGSDLAWWLWTMLLSGQPGQAYNVGSEHAVSIRELASVISEETGVAYEIVETPRPGATSLRYVPSTRKAREELGLCETIGLREAVRKTLRWHGFQKASGDVA